MVVTFISIIIIVYQLIHILNNVHIIVRNITISDYQLAWQQLGLCTAGTMRPCRF